MQNSFEQNYFVEIDEFLLHNWRKCGEGKLGYTRRIWNVGTPEEDAEAWQLLQVDFTRRFGVPMANIRMAELKAKHAKSIFKYLAEPADSPQKEFLTTNIAIYEDKLQAMLADKGDANSVDSTLLTLSRLEGMRLTPRTITVVEFHLLIQKHSNGKAG